MTKQLIALAIAAAFGVAHSADVKPAGTESKAATPAAATVKAEAPKTEVKAPEVKPAAIVALPGDAKGGAAKPVEKKSNKAKKSVKPAAEPANAEAAKQ